MKSPDRETFGTAVCRLPGDELGGDTRWGVFENPSDILVAWTPRDVRELLKKIEKAAESGAWAAGFISYEASPAFDPAFKVKTPSGESPLAWFAVYDSPPSPFQFPDNGTSAATALAAPPKPEIAAAAHIAAVETAKKHIFEGDIYQANLTFRCHAEAAIPPWDAFLDTISAHPAPYAAFIDTGETQIVSISPELFLERHGQILRTAPMKGTAPRGLDEAEDAEIAAALAADSKNRAENLMILDMARNDLGRICEPGSIKPDAIFRVEKYTSVFQMTSVVSGETRPDVSLLDCMDALFPPASITGAPKIRAMEIIADLEPSPRGVYTGCVGCVAPGGDFLFNVAIRTLEITNRKTKIGVGGGIVADSDPMGEWREALLKSKFAIARPLPEFETIETMLWHGGNASDTFSERRKRRLAATQRYFDRKWNEAAAISAIESAIASLPSSAEFARIRLLMDADGECHAQAVPLDRPGWPRNPAKILLAVRPENAIPPLFLRHKTTNRKFYDEAFKKSIEAGLDEIIFINEHGRLAEGAISNVFVKIDGEWRTPPLSDGLLPGLWRQEMIEKLGAAEKSVSLEELRSASEIMIGNSVRGGAAAEIVLATVGSGPALLTLVKVRN